VANAQYLHFKLHFASTYIDNSCFLACPIPPLLLCNNYTTFDAYHQIVTDFNLRKEETLYLYRENEVIETLKLPEIEEGRVFVRDLVTGIFTEQYE